MHIAIASDHGGFRLKGEIVGLLEELGHTYDDLGPSDPEAVDYPDYAQQVATAVAQGRYDRGILVCGTGQGMGMCANKIKGVRAAVCSDAYTARMSREHNDANVLCLGERVIGMGLATDIVHTWLESQFSNEERHRRRIARLHGLEGD